MFVGSCEDYISVCVTNAHRRKPRLCISLGTQQYVLVCTITVLLHSFHFSLSFFAGWGWGLVFALCMRVQKAVIKMRENYANSKG